MSPLTGCGLPLAMCTMPSTPNEQRRPADRPDDRRGRCARGRAGCARRRSTSSSGTNQPSLPTEPGDDGAGDLHDARRAAATRPRRRRRRRDRTGTARRRRAGARARGRGRCARCCARSLRARGRSPARPAARRVPERTEGARDRTAAVADGARRRAPALWAGAARVACAYSGIGSPSRPVFDELRDRLEPDLLDREEDVLLLRDPGGEDVRVAMVMNLGQSHTSHRDHTMRVARGDPSRPHRRRTKMDTRAQGDASGQEQPRWRCA